MKPKFRLLIFRDSEYIYRFFNETTKNICIKCLGGVLGREGLGKDWPARTAGEVGNYQPSQLDVPGQETGNTNEHSG
jgi:hypothetical protein